MYTEYMYKDSLAHHGILGQKWGVRRYQNPDGTLTPEGRARYGIKSTDSSVTKKVKTDLANMTEDQFRGKYRISKAKYMKRVDKYGDPYMNSPLAKTGKKLAEKNNPNKKSMDKIANDEVKAIQKDQNKKNAEKQLKEKKAIQKDQNKKNAEKQLKEKKARVKIADDTYEKYFNQIVEAGKVARDRHAAGIISDDDYKNLMSELEQFNKDIYRECYNFAENGNLKDGLNIKIRTK